MNPNPYVYPDSGTRSLFRTPTFSATRRCFVPAAVGWLSLLIALVSITPEASAQTVPDGFLVEEIHSRPGVKSLGFALLPDGRILVIGHQTGDVRLIVNGEMKEDPIGTIPGVAVPFSERGLLGIAVDPDFPDSNSVYFFYSSDTGFNRVSRFRLDGGVSDALSDDLTLDIASERILLELVDDSQYHNGGTIRFGSDKTLYVSHGEDERWKEEEQPYMQDLSNRYGKVLRINRDGSAPEDNPSFHDEGPDRLPEIFAIGLRNPFRFAVDPHTDRLFIGDVGTSLREEFNLSTGGENFGYPRYEGRTFFQETYALIAPDPTPPIYEYEYSKPSRRSAIALATYRPRNPLEDVSFPPSFDGVHFFADYFDDKLQVLSPDSVGGWESRVFGSGFKNLTDAAVGPDGSLYVISYDGPLRKISYDRTGTETEDRPGTFDVALRQNYPNPFDRATTITYELAQTESVRLEIFDLLGRRVRTLVDERQPPGIHAARFHADGLAAGTYTARLTAGGVSRTKLMIRLPEHARD